MLRLLAEEMCMGVRKNKDAVVAIDQAEFAACVAREARVPDRMHIPCAHAIAGSETRSYRDVAVRGHTFCNQRGSFFRSECGSRFGRSLGRFPALKLGATN